MKSLMIGVATALALMATPAFAADSGSISGSPAANSAGSTTNSNQTNPPCTSNNQLGCGSMGGVDSNSGATSGSSSSGSSSGGSMTGSGSSSSTSGTGGNSLGNSGSMGTGSDGPVGTQQPSRTMGGGAATGTGSTVR
ncbi:hypothetical protein TSH100_13700 [Azospirillum sp. TSH100]|uniref:hypothetical protein n=1 Tax=Azospirillum sp. TSH100 TaxID=652764 RepID=UPI000D6175DE|nr:hypothetical protein [Azospirillum sp. TSH100]PWC86186.1 hypothetical protein TSH100_13700 [Azospirillum sp. TSH100]